MATPGERFQSWIEGLSAAWKDRLKGWLAAVIGFGIEVFMDILAKSYSEKLKGLIETMEGTPDLPEELKPLLAEMKNPKGEAAAAALTNMGNALVGGAVSRITNSLLSRFSYNLAAKVHPIILEIDGIIEAMKRRIILPDVGRQMLAKHGLEPETIEQMIELGRVLFPSDLAERAWLRNKTEYEWLWTDVNKLGVDEKHIGVLKELAYRMPSVQDVVSFLAHEVFEPEMIAKYGLDDEWGELDKSLFEKVGMKEEMALNYWRNHWQHAQWNQVTTMLHRGELTDQDVYDWYRLVEIPPYWRDKLTALSWDLPNRIELRMMARYGLVDKAFLMDTFKKIGVHEDYREVIADMNLSTGLLTDLRTRYRNGYISTEKIRAELATAGLAPAVQERLYQYIVKVEGPERVAAEKMATATEVMSGVKKGVITWEEGVGRLVAMNYSEAEAIFKLEVYLATSTGSPESLAEFKHLTDLYRVANDLPTERSKEEILQSAKAIAAKHPQKVKLSDEEVKLRVDTTRRKRRRGELTRDEEVTELLKIGIDISLATAYTENDDLRLQKGVEE